MYRSLFWAVLDKMKCRFDITELQNRFCRSWQGRLCDVRTNSTCHICCRGAVVYILFVLVNVYIGHFFLPLDRARSDISWNLKTVIPFNIYLSRGIVVDSFLRPGARPTVHYRLSSIKCVPFRFANFGSHFVTFTF